MAFAPGSSSSIPRHPIRVATIRGLGPHLPGCGPCFFGTAAPMMKDFEIAPGQKFLGIFAPRSGRQSKAGSTPD
jgi:hypothetical protein